MPDPAVLPKATRLLHEMLERIADKWSLLVLSVLDHETRRSRNGRRV
jgi:DNA-binding HxlR family transcriptional regulator